MIQTSEGNLQLTIERFLRDAMRQGAETEGLPQSDRDHFRHEYAETSARLILHCVAASIVESPMPILTANTRGCADGGPPCISTACGDACQRALKQKET